jgi:hypothetical protein
MAVIVGITVEDDRIMGCPEKNEILLISFVPKKRTKKTAGSFTGA